METSHHRHGQRTCTIVVMTTTAIASISQLATPNCRDVTFDDGADNSAATERTQINTRMNIIARSAYIAN